jgi:hypothetical protein
MTCGPGQPKDGERHRALTAKAVQLHRGAFIGALEQEVVGLGRFQVRRGFRYMRELFISARDQDTVGLG